MSDVLPILRAIYGRLLTTDYPVKYRDMTDGEREALIAQHQDDLDRDNEALNAVIDQSRSAGIAAAISAIRNAEGLDAETIDEILESFPVQ